MKFNRKMVVQVAPESVIGTDPGSGYVAILTNVGSEIRAAGELVKRDVVRSTFTPQGHVIGVTSFSCTLPVELKGGGVNAGVPVDPEVDVLLQACGLVKSDAAIISIDTYTAPPAFAIGEVLEKTVGGSDIGTIFDVIDTGTGTADLYLRNITVANLPAVAASVTGVTSTATGAATAVNRGLCYRPTSDRSAMTTATIHYNLDGIRHIATGVRGTFTLDLSVGKYGAFQFAMQGTYANPTDESLPSVSYSTIIPPPVFSAGLKIGTWTMSTTATEQVTFDMGNTVVERRDVNASAGLLGFEISGREPKGTVNPEVSALSDYNAWSLWKAATSAKIYCQIGATLGNRCRILIPAATYSEPTYQDRNGIIAYNLPFVCTVGTDGTDGDNEVYILFS